MKTDFYRRVRRIMLASAFGLLTACGSTPTEEESTAVYDAGTDTTLDSDGGATSVGVGDDGGVSGSGIGADDGMGALETVFYFDYDQATLSLDIRATLDAHASRIKNAGRRVRLEGHADERGTREYNLALAERRANAVANYLVLKGVDRTMIETVSYGEERPAALGSDEESWSMNRRVELQ